MVKQKVKIELPDGRIIERVPKQEMFGNFVMLTVRYNNKRYLISEGDEYLRGYPEVFRLIIPLIKNKECG